MSAHEVGSWPTAAVRGDVASWRQRRVKRTVGDPMGLSLVERRRNLVERLRKNGNAGVDGDTAFDAAGEIEACVVAFENEARKLKSCEKAGDALNKTITELGIQIDHQRTEIERLKTDTAAIMEASGRGFRRGYHAAASRFAGIVYELVQMTVPIGQQQQHQEPHHHGP
jgi:hypothetical protein